MLNHNVKKGIKEGSINLTRAGYVDAGRAEGGMNIESEIKLPINEKQYTQAFSIIENLNGQKIDDESEFVLKADTRPRTRIWKYVDDSNFNLFQIGISFSVRDRGPVEAGYITKEIYSGNKDKGQAAFKDLVKAGMIDEYGSAQERFVFVSKADFIKSIDTLVLNQADKEQLYEKLMQFYVDKINDRFVTIKLPVAEGSKDRAEYEFSLGNRIFGAITVAEMVVFIKAAAKGESTDKTFTPEIAQRLLQALSKKQIQLEDLSYSVTWKSVSSRPSLESSDKGNHGVVEVSIDQFTPMVRRSGVISNPQTIYEIEIEAKNKIDKQIKDLKKTLKEQKITQSEYDRQLKSLEELKKVAKKQAEALGRAVISALPEDMRRESGAAESNKYRRAISQINELNIRLTPNWKIIAPLIERFDERSVQALIKLKVNPLLFTEKLIVVLNNSDQYDNQKFIKLCLSTLKNIDAALVEANKLKIVNAIILNTISHNYGKISDFYKNLLLELVNNKDELNDLLVNYARQYGNNSALRLLINLGLATEKQLKAFNDFDFITRKRDTLWDGEEVDYRHDEEKYRTEDMLEVGLFTTTERKEAKNKERALQKTEFDKKITKKRDVNVKNVISTRIKDSIYQSLQEWYAMQSNSIKKDKSFQALIANPDELTAQQITIVKSNAELLILMIQSYITRFRNTNKPKLKMQMFENILRIGGASSEVLNFLNSILDSQNPNESEFKLKAAISLAESMVAP